MCRQRPPFRRKLSGPRVRMRLTSLKKASRQRSVNCSSSSPSSASGRRVTVNWILPSFQNGEVKIVGILNLYAISAQNGEYVTGTPSHWMRGVLGDMAPSTAIAIRHPFWRASKTCRATCVSVRSAVEIRVSENFVVATRGVDDSHRYGLPSPWMAIGPANI